MDERIIAQDIAESLQKKLKTEYGTNVNVTATTVPKNNGTLVEGLMFKTPGRNVSPTIHIDRAIDAVSTGHSTIAEVVDSLANTYMNSKPPMELSKAVEDINFESTKKNVYCEAINYEANKKMLSETPHKRVEDLAIIARYKVSQDGSFIVKDGVLDRMGMSGNEVVEYAIKNSIEEGYKIEPMISVLQDIMGPMDAEMSAAMPDPGLYVISNESRVHGGAGVYVDRALRAEIRDVVGGDYYILPSSIHECIVVRDDGMTNYADLQEMVMTINETQVSPAERLSNSVYYVDATLKVTQCTAETMAEKIADAMPAESTHCTLAM